MQRKYCKLCRFNSCAQGMQLKMPRNYLRQLWVCKSCLLVSDNPIVTYNAKIGTFSKQAILQGDVLPCPYLCARKPPRICQAPQSHLWLAVQDFSQSDSEVIRAIETHRGGHRGGEIAPLVAGTGTGRTLIREWPDKELSKK